MAKWETEILGNEIGEEVKSEYRKLLSVNIGNEDAESILVKYFEPRFGDDPIIEGQFWMALSLCEWQLGRLTQTAKINAKKWTEFPNDDLSPSTLQSLSELLDMPMPHQKKVRLPAYVSRCPWPVGSLLAYRIISSDHPHVTRSPFFGKYVLLRIIKINRTPISNLAPSAGWDESMLVGLYNWMGDSIPHPDIARNLEFTAITVEAPTLRAPVFQKLQVPSLSTEFRNQLQQVISGTTTQRIETCCDLDWNCPKKINRNDVFTYLSCEASYESNIPPFFKTNIADYSMCHSIPFDAVLVNRFYQLTEATSKDASLH